MKHLLALAMLGISANADAWSLPQEAVQQFVDFDLDGGRLQSWPFERYLAVDPEYYDEPAWDMVQVVQSHRILPSSCKTKSCTI